MDSRTVDPALRIWALTGARAGDNDQVIALAEALGVPFEVKPLQFGALRLLGPRLLGPTLASLSARSRHEITRKPLPDLTISTGHRSVATVRFLKKASGGKMRAIHVGFPRVSPGKFDLVILTPQYHVEDHPNLLHTPYALTRAVTGAVDPADRATLEMLPRPRTLLIVGGPSLYWTIDRDALLHRLSEILAEAKRSGGSVLVSSSPRTPDVVEREIAAMLSNSEVPAIHTWPGLAPHYSSLLEAADSILVTADSVAMISDAIWTGKPLGCVPVKKSALGRLAMGASDLLRPHHPVYPQDLRRFWRALAEMGIAQRPAVPKTSTRRELERVLARVRPIINELFERS